MSQESEYRKKFKQLETNFQLLDNELADFASHHLMRINPNMYGVPSRTLEIPGNPHYCIDIKLVIHWTQVQTGNLKYLMGAGAMYSPKPRIYFLTRKTIVENETLENLRTNLSTYLVDSMNSIKEWTPEVILRDGKKFVRPGNE